MKTATEIRTEIERLILEPSGPMEQISHREGHIRGLLWALTGEQAPEHCLRHGIPVLCRMAGIRCDLIAGGYWISAEGLPPPPGAIAIPAPPVQ